jgi:type I restriction enzyme S subunit
VSNQSEWQKVTLRDLCESVRYGYTAKAQNEPVGPQFLRITDIVPDLINWTSVPYCEINPGNIEKYRLQKGDIVIARTGATTGYAKWVKDPPEAIFASYLVRLRIAGEHDSRYVGLVVESDTYKQFIMTNVGGAAQPNANAQVLTSFPLLLPPLPTQRKIAAILSAYDDLIENNTRRIAALEGMARLLYREWFVHFRFPGHEQAALVDSELGPMPEGWEIVPYTEIAEVLSGGTPSTRIPEYWNGPIPFFSPRDIKSSCYVLETERSITELGLSKCSSDLYPQNTVFITARGTVGKVVMPAVPMAMNQTCYALEGQDGIDQYFVFLSICSQVERLRQRAYGAVFDTIIVDTFRRLKMVKPPMFLIQRLHALVSPIFDQVLNLLEKNINLRRTRDLLLPRLISGEVDVSELEPLNH